MTPFRIEVPTRSWPTCASGWPGPGGRSRSAASAGTAAPSRGGSGAARSLVPALVVVDSWNVRGQCHDVLGERRFPSVDGIRRGLAAYGFDVLHVYAAAAVDRQPGGVTAALEQRLAMTDRFAAAVDAHPLGTVLRGRIAERDGIPEEKLVDVLCALWVLRSATEISAGRTPARVVIVLSEDIDLTPSYEMAAELGVPVYAAANETVHLRPGSWLVLGDAAMIDFCGRAEGPDGPAVAFLPPSGASVRSGDRYAAVPSRHSGGKVSHVLAVSSVLP